MPPYNLLIHSAPVVEPAGDYYHWHVEIIPKLTQGWPAFEWATGFYLQPDVAGGSGPGAARSERAYVDAGVRWTCEPARPGRLGSDAWPPIARVRVIATVRRERE